MKLLLKKVLLNAGRFCSNTVESTSSPLFMTTIYAILRPRCLFGTMRLFGSFWSSDVGFDRDIVMSLPQLE